MTRPRGTDRNLDDPQKAVRLSRALEVLRGEAAWRERDRNSATLVKGTGLRVVLVALHAGAAIKEHSAEGPITVQVLQGRLDFAAGGETHALAAGDLLTLGAGIPHAVHAPEEAAFLLTIAGA